MTSYVDSEASVQDGAPIGLFDFYCGVNEWHYTSSGIDYEDNSGSPTVVYTSTSIDIPDDIESTSEEVRSDISIVVSRTNPIADLFRVIAPTRIITVQYREVHRGENDYAPLWFGQILSAVQDGANYKLKCSSLSASEIRSGPTERVQKTCNNTLFDSRCGLDPDAWKHDTVVDAIVNNVVTVDSLGAGPYSGGEFTWVDSDGNVNSRFIESLSGLDLSLQRPPYGLSVSDAVTVYPFCALSADVCLNTFNNLANMRGRPHLTTKNAFGGGDIF